VTPDQLALLRERVEWKGMALIVHAWSVIIAAMLLVAVFPNPLTYILAVMLIGSRQLGLIILCTREPTAAFRAARAATWP
jgi:hypothetical protein